MVLREFDFLIAQDFKLDFVANIQYITLLVNGSNCLLKL